MSVVVVAEVDGVLVLKLYGAFVDTAGGSVDDDSDEVVPATTAIQDDVADPVHGLNDDDNISCTAAVQDGIVASM